NIHMMFNKSTDIMRIIIIFIPCLQHSKKININHPALRTGLEYTVLAGLNGRGFNSVVLKLGND
ncbi:MAG: hypothetical protein LIO97_12010, partial [Tannerellaceae bacterium]|nr:hypothetical protein [Tannerellaceae bacterium]